mgnify:CR=1 FL=1
MWKVALEKKKIVWFYVANSEENLIKGVSSAKKINMEDTLTSREFKKTTDRTRT